MTKAKQDQQLESKYKEKELTIDLNIIHNPNPAIGENYKNANATDVYMDFREADTIYQYPWEKIKPQLLKWKKEGIIKDDCNFTVIYGTNLEV